jgi:glycosyltransferase involved in cell wall biosynthesis
MGGLVLLEAMALGIPVIAADCPTGPRELLNGGALGAIVAAEDAEALASAIVDYLADPAPLRAKARGGPARVEDFNPTMAAKRFVNVLNRISGRPQQTRIERPRTSSRRIHLAA